MQERQERQRKNRKATRDLILVILAVLLVLLIAALLVLRQADSVPPPEPEIAVQTPEPPPEPEIIEVESIEIVLESVEVPIGYRFHVDVIIQPYNATDKSFEFISDNEFVVRQQGDNWFAAGAGTANIIAIANNGIMAMAEIIVVPPEIEAIVLFHDDIIIALGDTITLTLTFTPKDAVPEEPIQFTSDDEDIAIVSEYGDITAVGVGTTTITAAVGEIYTQVNVEVIIPATNISISMNRHAFTVGDEAEIIITIDPPDATNVSISISFSGAPVTQTGPYTFICNALGEVIITFTTEDGRSLRHTVMVYDLEVLAEEVFRLTNNERAYAGLPLLDASEPLSRAAYVRANEIIIRLAEDHTRPDGREFYTVFGENDVEYRRAGENLAAGQMSAVEVVQGWMDSPGHRKNILNADFGRLGIGVTMSGEGRIYWTQLFTD
ncbi:MAG: CAP domain-containing protein [Oscillospiraceae bacterium]|nr:CAP domain-containing protein [Oscillospiraceae bacterium]